jgi:imidazolonepropionase
LDAHTQILRGLTAASAGLFILDAAIILRAGRIDWIGPSGDLPDLDAQSRDLGGRLVTPALIDCHTHIVHAGHRADEFAQRLNGASYAEISRAGGGIMSSVRATRAASEDDLIAHALPFVDALIAEGVAVIEVKSGYGLNPDAELKMLRVARRLGQIRPVLIKTSYLAAHATPPEYAGRGDDYMDLVCIPTLRLAHQEGLVDAVDGFCEGIAFSPAQMTRLFQSAQALGLPVKLHAEQLSNLGGAALAAQFGALSADHLEYLDQAGVQAMADAGTVAVILPGAFYTLHEVQKPPIDLLRQHGVPMALASDMNRGSSPMASVLLAMNMGCTLFGMTPDEVFAGTTAHAALALGLTDRGRLVAGQVADLAVWNADHPNELSYRIGFNPLFQRIIAGQI